MPRPAEASYSPASQPAAVKKKKRSLPDVPPGRWSGHSQRWQGLDESLDKGPVKPRSPRKESKNAKKRKKSAKEEKIDKIKAIKRFVEKEGNSAEDYVSDRKKIERLREYEGERTRLMEADPMAALAQDRVTLRSKREIMPQKYWNKYKSPSNIYRNQ